MKKMLRLEFIKDAISPKYKTYLKRTIGPCYLGLCRFLATRTKITKIDVTSKYSLSERYRFFESAQYFLQTNRINGIYLEFGSHELNTFRMALNTLGAYDKPNKIHKFISFDSFEGMPEPKGIIDKQKIWRKTINYTSVDMF